MSKAERTAMLEVTVFESLGRFKDAEDALIKFVETLDPEDCEKRGVLHIDLGQIAEKDERPHDAIRYFQHSIQLLANLKGDALLQCGHAHFNVARVYYNERHFDQCVTHAERSLSIYETTPLAVAEDSIFAKTLLCLCTIASNTMVDFNQFDRIAGDLWRIPHTDTDGGVIRSFLTLYLVQGRLASRDLREFYRESFAWDRKLMIDVLKDVREAMIELYLSKPSIEDDPTTDGTLPYRGRFTESEWSGIESMTVGILLHVAQSHSGSSNVRKELERLFVAGESELPSTFMQELFDGMKGGDLLALLKRSVKLSEEGHKQVKETLCSKLSGDELKRFSGAVFAESWNLAITLDDKITEDARGRLIVFARYLDVDVSSIPIVFFSRPGLETRLLLAIFHEELEISLAIGASGIDSAG